MAAQLKKSLGLWSLVAFGVGDILGAGIYALIGKVAGVAGNAVWMAFFAAFAAALFTAFSYAELASRFPHAGGESHYTEKAFRRPLLSYLIGFLVLMSGLVSISAVSHGFAGYLKIFFPDLPNLILLPLFLTVLALIAFWGMRESSIANIICTLVEVSGLLIIIAVGISHFGKVNYFEVGEGVRPLTSMGSDPFSALMLILQGGMLSFYAFIGFEDMVKAAEETERPEINFPRAILISLGIVIVLYGLVAMIAVAVVPAGELAQSGAPLLLVVERAAPWFPKWIFNAIALFAVTNTALVNFVMSSRLIYGMAEEKLIPAFLGKIHPARKTPHIAIGIILAITLFLSLTGTLARLAQSTSLILLTVFFIVNLSLICLKKKGQSPKGTVPFHAPAILPYLGVGTTLLLACFVQRGAFITVAIIGGVGLLIYRGMKIKH